MAQLEAELAQRNEDLRIARAELASFTYSVAHDLRAPLRAITGFGEALEEDYASVLDEQGRDYLQRIRNATERMEHLIESLVELSRVSGKDLNVEPVDVTAAAQRVMSRFKPAIAARSVEIVIQPGLKADADSDLLETCFRHLADNAVKFTSHNASARIEIGSEVQDGKPVLFVRDDGAGFDPRYADKMFGAFQRLHSTDEFDGVGIGLAIVERIINRHGGRVWAAGSPGKGATFYVAL